LKKYINIIIEKVKSKPIHYSLLLLSLLIIFLNAYFVLDSWGRKLLLFMGADEPVWIDNAIKYFHEGKGSPYSHVPLFHDLIIPFVTGMFFSFETGYIVWKILLFVVSSILFFYIIYKISNLWIGFLFTVHYELMLNFVSFPSYSILAMIFFLLALSIIIQNKNNIGIAFGILLIGGLVRLELILFGIIFFILSAVFFYKLVFSKKFIYQVSVPIIIFIALIYWHGSSITSFPKDYLFRGNQSSVWYVIDYMYYKGYFKKYTDAGRGNIPMDVLDKVLEENFGKNLEGLNNSSFIEMYRANPKIIKDRYKKMVGELPGLLASNFFVKIPYKDMRGLYIDIFFIAGLLPFFLLFFSIKFFKQARTFNIISRYNSFITSNKKISGVLIIIVLASFAGFIPWMMTKPMEHYTIMALPSFYIIIVLFLYLICSLINKLFGGFTISSGT